MQLITLRSGAQFTQDLLRALAQGGELGSCVRVVDDKHMDMVLVLGFKLFNGGGYSGEFL